MAMKFDPQKGEFVPDSEELVFDPSTGEFSQSNPLVPDHEIEVVQNPSTSNQGTHDFFGDMFQNTNELLGANLIEPVSQGAFTIERLLDRATQIAQNQRRTWCFTLTPKTGGDAWIQLTFSFLNLYYPHPNDPVAQMRTEAVNVPAGTELVNWEPKSFATFDHGQVETLRQVAAFVVDYTERILDVRADFNEWNVEDMDMDQPV